MVTDELLQEAYEIALIAKHTVISLNPRFKWTERLAKDYLVVDSDWVCDECNKTFASKQSLANHSKVCGTKRTFKMVTCPHCDKEGMIQVMTRYHFDNCKLK